MKRDLCSVRDFSPKEIETLIELAQKLKEQTGSGITHSPLQGKTLVLLFCKPSTRTRISFEVGMYQLGGQSLYLNYTDTHLGRGESLADTARVLSRYVQGIVLRTYAHQDLVELARTADIPLINGLTDLLHPCQILADLLTIKEKFHKIKGVRIVYIGDGNNIANSWLMAAGHLGLKLRLAIPEGYLPDPEIVKFARTQAPKYGGEIEFYHDPWRAVQGAQVLYTDVWTSMGQEEEVLSREKAFQNYQISAQLLAQAAPDAIVMHCLPAHRGEEIAGEVLENKRSVVFDQAENRLHIQKAILNFLLAPQNLP